MPDVTTTTEEAPVSAPLHTLSAPVATEASEPGALPGHECRCSCGFVARTSLSAREAQSQAVAHANYMRSTGR